MTNIVLICNDCLRYDYVTKEHMPNLVDIAKSGAVFKSCISGGGGTGTSIPYFLSSQRVYDRHINLPTVMKSHGYKTAIIHSNPAFDVFKYGFELHVDLIHTFTYAVAWKIRKLCGMIGEEWWLRVLAVRRAMLGRERVVARLKERPYIRAGLTFQTCRDWLDTTKGDKFLWIQTMDTHIPYCPAESSIGITHERMLDLYNKILRSTYAGEKISPQETEDIKSLYADEVRYLDRELGKFIRSLSDCIVIITSDHGDSFGEYGSYSHTGLKYHGLTPQLIHVPLIFLGEQIKPGVIEQDVSTMDIAPTILDLVGIEDRFGYGKSLKELII